MSKSKLPGLIDAFHTTLQDLDADYKAYKKLDSSKNTIHMNEVRLTNLETSFDEARVLHQKIVEAPTEEAKVKYMDALTFHNLKEIYFNYSCELKEQISKIESQGFQNKSLIGSNAPSPSVELKLPPIKIPTFDGSLKMWPEFKGLFEAIVNKNTSISDAHKLQYLKGNLSGEAARILRNTDTNFESAWALLVKRFQNIRLLKDNQFKLLFDQSKITQESSEELKLLLDTTNEAKQSLKNLGVAVESWEDVFIFHTVQKLPYTTRGLWESHISTHVDYPQYSVLEDLILMRSRTLDVIGQSSSGLNHQKSKKTSSNTNNLCFNCLSNSHFTQNCTSTFTCSTCHQKHHSLLHLNGAANATQVTENIPVPQSNKATSSSVHTSQSGSESTAPLTAIASANNACLAENEIAPVLLATALIKFLIPAGQPLLLRALLDQGSESSFITESAAQLLNLKKEKNRVKVIGVGESNVSTSNWKVTLTILSNVNTDFTLQLNALVLPKLSAILPTHKIPMSNWNHLKNIELADPKFNKPSKIDILLGSDAYSSIILEGLIKGPQGTPIAQRTELGWVLSGGISPDSHSQVQAFHIKTESESLDQMLRKFWELEEIQDRKFLSPDDEKCEKHFCRTHQRQLDGKYVVQLPFKEGTYPSIGLSQRSALVRFLQLERKFKTNSLFKEEYTKVFNEYKELGHMTEVPLAALNSLHYFLPHHAVVKEASSTTKLRIVFDASCKTSDGTSLNDHLYIGPRLQDDVFDHIARFRRFKVAFAADITKMYRQIWVTPDDSMYQLVLWRDVEGGEVKAYRLNTVTFGTASAPYLAIRMLQQLASDERDDFPLAI
ncbi:uncharacterized protein LOC129953210 [Eupeodes corollae]|uniref:uncharacterized protein LOC129953210 n=1 Tax=Eupeodes corollae TaxID=290404 RepID=UPI002493B29D|nr:uncharacterized protein LOC129953210 [Eupeodes corollae]